MRMFATKENLFQIFFSFSPEAADYRQNYIYIIQGILSEYFGSRGEAFLLKGILIVFMAGRCANK